LIKKIYKNLSQKCATFFQKTLAKFFKSGIIISVKGQEILNKKSSKKNKKTLDKLYQI
jgi:hypothetical protein